MDLVKEDRLIEKVPLGSIFQHYKNKKKYKIISLGRHTETKELLVVYQGLYTCEQYGDAPVWIRPLSMFLETVDNDGLPIPRFIRIQKNNFTN